MSKAVRRQCLVNTIVSRRELQRPGSATGDVAELVATYAPVGLRRRHARLSLVTAAVAVPLLLVLLAGLAWTQVGPRLGPGSTQVAQIDELGRLTRSLAAEVEAITGQREEFQAQRELFRQQSVLLAEELAAVGAQRAELEQQRYAFESQGRRMAAAISDIDTRRVTIQQQQNEIERHAPLIEQELAAMKAERNGLEDRRREYAEQGELLSVEIAAINQQRRELAKQRLQVERQRKEIQALLDKTSEIQSRLMQPEGEERGVDSPMLAGEDPAPGDADAVVASVDTWRPPEINSLTAVEDGDLSTMRGGINIGDDMVIDIGLTRSANINGVEQYSSTIQLDDVMGGVSPQDVSAVGGVLIQSGAGNIAPADLLNSSTGNFTIIQNSLDHQNIVNENVFDISVENVSSAIKGIAASQAIDDTLLLRN